MHQPTQELTQAPLLTLDAVYPPGPSAAPPKLSEASTSYRRRAWVAMLVLVTFGLLYAGLLGWFGYTLYRIAIEFSRGRFQLPLIGVALLAGCLTLFLSKALFAVKRSETSDDLEIKRADQPLLWAFLERLADEAGAPRPHRLFLSGAVNAGVFYDVSAKNLLLPSQKNLEIGLGLVNVLTLGELKAVLAHEFGHFAQRSMAVGRWVYTAQQIISHVVHVRGMLDRALRVLSNQDIRIAWIGWLMRLVVWALRALLDTGFSLVVLAQRALSREMEMQADLVAVSLTGSDALIHALHRLRAADEAWDITLGFAGQEFSEGRLVPDLFALQSRVIEHMRAVMDDETFGVPPALPGPDALAQHRVFERELAQPPRMWLTHPPGSEREDNAKRVYVPAPLDERSAWTLFQDPPALRTSMTTRLLSSAKREPPPELVSTEAALTKLDEEFSRPRVQRRYRGIYLTRRAMRDVADARELHGELPAPEQVDRALAALYPSSLAADLKRLRVLEEELETLEALREGTLVPPDGMIRHRGRVVRKRDLPRAIANLKDETQAARTKLSEHDKSCRSAHLAAARKLGAGWDDHLRGLAALLHYAEHSEANLRDAFGFFQNVFAIVTADGKVSGREMRRLVAAATELHVTLWEIFQQRTSVQLPEELAKALEAESWQAALPPELQLPSPSQENIVEFLNVLDSWVEGILGPLATLRGAALDALLRAEDHVERCVSSGSDPGAAPRAASVPAQYKVMPHGTARERQRRLHWWDRFVLGDGLFPSVARFAVALGILAPVLHVSRQNSEADIYVYNGFDDVMEVSINEAKQLVGAHARAKLSVSLDPPLLKVATHTRSDQLVEQFTVDASNDDRYFYNIASAAPLVQWTAYYGTRAPQNSTGERRLGSPRWGVPPGEVVFEDPPERVKSGSQRVVLSGLGEMLPSVAAEFVTDLGQRRAMIAAHARWESMQSQVLIPWLQLLSGQPEWRAILTQRIARNPKDIPALRAMQDLSRGAEHEEICAQHGALAAAHPEDADYLYLTLRCQDDATRSGPVFISALRQHPTHPWLAGAAAREHFDQGNWQAGLDALTIAFEALPNVSEAWRVEAARAARLLGRSTDGLERGSKDLRMLRNLERGGNSQQQQEAQAYAALAKGALDEAVQLAEATPAAWPRILRLAGASPAASPALVEKALTLPADRGIDQSTLWPSLILHRLHHRDPQKYAALAADAFGEKTGALIDLDPKQLAKRPEQALAELKGLDLMRRGHVLVGWIMQLSPHAPKLWVDQARALLFIPERPYLGP